MAWPVREGLEEPAGLVAKGAAGAWPVQEDLGELPEPEEVLELEEAVVGREEALVLVGRAEQRVVLRIVGGAAM